MGSFEDLTNQKFGMLTAIKYSGNKNRKSIWLCRCECGEEKNVRKDKLKAGRTKSCGCQKKFIDLTGNKYGMLEVIERVEYENNSTTWLCKCDCGNERVAVSKALKNGTVWHCGCKITNKLRDLTGKRFGRYLVIKRAENDKNNNVRWLCKCDCGNERVVYARSLITGESKSCGCLKDEILLSSRSQYKKPNTYIFFDDYIEVCTKNNEKFLIDKEDFYIIENRSCYIDKKYVRMGNKTLSRIIMDCPKNKVVDHINHDTLDNRKSNLRIVTHQQNMFNSSVNKNNTSGVKGVYYNKANQKWKAIIGFNNEKINLGYYNNFKDAVKAREKAEIKYHGEFRNTSQPVCETINV